MTETWENNFEKMTTMHENMPCHRCGAPPGYFCRDGCEDIEIETLLSPEQIEYLQAHQDMTPIEIAETINNWRNTSHTKYNPECCQCGCYLRLGQMFWKCPNIKCPDKHAWSATCSDEVLECNDCAVEELRT